MFPPPRGGLSPPCPLGKNAYERISVELSYAYQKGQNESRYPQVDIKTGIFACMDVFTKEAGGLRPPLGGGNITKEEKI